MADGPKLIPEGYHTSVPCVDVGFKPTREGEGFLFLVFKNEAGETAVFQGWLTEKGWPWTEKALTALGWDPKRNNFDLEVLVDQKPVVGKAADLKVLHETEEWTDKETQEARSRVVSGVQFVNPPGGMYRMGADESKAFAQKVRGNLMRWSANPKSAATKSSGGAKAPSPAPAGGEDIPF